MAMRQGNPFPPEVRRLKAYEMRQIITKVRLTLWFNTGPGDPIAAPDKERATSMLDEIADVLEAHALKPDPPRAPTGGP
jgi:hypothetical protein